VKTVDYGPRWRVHYVRVRSEADVDDELIAWSQESHDTMGVQIDLRGAPEVAAQTDRLDSPP
jgi:hypothetical protein